MLDTTEGAIANRAFAMREEAEAKAIDSLARYKFEMFGYWAAIWVDVNRIIGDRKPSPFSALVRIARELRDDSIEEESV